jgi:hypothetical protein
MAVADGLINKPGDRLPAMDFYSKKYFIKKAKEPTGIWFYLYVEHCPSCGQRIGENNE